MRAIQLSGDSGGGTDRWRTISAGRCLPTHSEDPRSESDTRARSRSRNTGNRLLGSNLPARFMTAAEADRESESDKKAAAASSNRDGGTGRKDSKYSATPPPEAAEAV